MLFDLARLKGDNGDWRHCEILLSRDELGLDDSYQMRLMKLAVDIYGGMYKDEKKKVRKEGLELYGEGNGQWASNIVTT